MTSPDKPMHRDRQPNSEAPRTYSRQAFHIEAITNEAEANCIDVFFDNFNTYLDSAWQHPVFLQHLAQTHILILARGVHSGTQVHPLQSLKL
jgi:hypothetical protein